MSTTDNPAGRLYQAIIEMNETSPDGGSPMSAVLINTFDLPEDDEAIVLMTLANLIKLALDGQMLVESLDGIDRERYGLPFLVVKQSLSKLNLENHWRIFRQAIDENTLSSLQFVSDMLSVHAGDKVIDEASLAELLADVIPCLKNS